MKNNTRKVVSQFFVAVALGSVSLIDPRVFAAETVQPGFVLHDAGKSNISLSSVRSGELCADIAGTDNVCNTGTKLTVEGYDSCIGTDGKPYPCTRYGYRYDYSGATPGTQIECRATRRDPFNKKQKTYTVAIDAASGSVFEPQWIPYGPVERPTMLTEVHECVYLGEPLATIEYIITYEAPAEPAPTVTGGPNPDIDEPYSFGVPDACNYLTKGLAHEWVEEEVEPYTGAIEHLPILRSHCAYFGKEDITKRARIEHKYHLYELFDVEKRSPDQLNFHAAFAAGGYYPEKVLTDLGKITFVFQLPEEDRSAITVVTGIQGPPDGAGRPMELLAHYHLRTPDRSHEERLACLLDLARKSLDLWLSKVSATDNTVVLPDQPADLGAGCPQ